MSSPLEIGDGDPWTVSLSTLTLAPDQPSGHASREVPGGRIDAQRFGDGVTVPYHAYIRFYSDPAPVKEPRFPTMTEALEACDRLFPKGHVVAFPMFVAGSSGVVRAAQDGEPLQVVCHGPSGAGAPFGADNETRLRLEPS